MDDSPDGRLIADGNGNKEILAPDEGPRENLITTAVKFLQNPKVMTSPLYQKKAFLEKKGLTQNEISIAIQRSGVKEAVPDEHPQTQNQSGNPSQLIGLNSQPPAGYFMPIPPRSGWARARDLTMTTVVVASVSYAVYQLFQKYVRPVVFGKSFEQKRFENLQDRVSEIEKSVAESLLEVNKSLAEVLKSLNQQHSQFSAAGGELRGISDLKADVASLKGLLLNKSQFPPAPSTSPVLPSWQRTQAPLPVSASSVAAPSYADVVKTSTAGHDEETSSAEQTEVTNSTDSQLSVPESASDLTPKMHNNTESDQFNS